jgi:hypothetical protein
MIINITIIIIIVIIIVIIIIVIIVIIITTIIIILNRRFGRIQEGICPAVFHFLLLVKIAQLLGLWGYRVIRVIKKVRIITKTELHMEQTAN